MSELNYASVDPNSEEILERYPFAGEAAAHDALEQAAVAFDAWSRRALAERVDLVVRAAELLDAQAGELAELMAREMGKRVVEGEAEARKCAWVCRYYAENSATFLAPEEREADGSEAWVRSEPLGPILAIMPWNFPFWQFFRFAAPALIAGNVVLLKHAPSTPGCALRIERLLREAGCPRASYRTCSCRTNRPPC